MLCDLGFGQVITFPTHQRGHTHELVSSRGSCSVKWLHTGFSITLLCCGLACLFRTLLPSCHAFRCCWHHSLPVWSSASLESTPQMSADQLHIHLSRLFDQHALAMLCKVSSQDPSPCLALVAVSDCEGEQRQAERGWLKSRFEIDILCAVNSYWHCGWKATSVINNENISACIWSEQLFAFTITL